MPFRSKRQQRFMYATKPRGINLKEWADKTNFGKLPEKIRKKKISKKDNNKAEVDLPNKGTKFLDVVLAYAKEYLRQAKHIT
jgi:hypothetical protein